ncbi:MAG: aromatic amino acid transport family protein [archaeon]
MSKKRLFEAVATLVGCTIGAGILGIPYVVAKAGLLTGLVNIFLVGILFLIINLLLGEITLRTKGRHQLPGYAGRYLGRGGKILMFISVIIGDYGAITAYILGGGTALSSLLGTGIILSGTLFFLFIAGLIYLGLEAIEDSEMIATPILLGILLLFIVLAFLKIDHSNLSGFALPSFFMPFGVMVFAMVGTAAIPEMREELIAEKKNLKKAIIIGTLIPVVFYAVFAIAIVGVHGLGTGEIATMHISDIVGEDFAFLGELFAIFNMTTSFLAIGLALKEIFWYDFGLKKGTAWFLSCFVPYMLFLLLAYFGIAGFITILEISGTVGGVITGSLIIITAMQAKRFGERKPEYELKIKNWLAALIVILLVTAGIFKLTMMF